MTDLTAAVCVGGGMVWGGIADLFSGAFGTRIGDATYSLIHGSSETQGVALADIVFLNLEAAGFADGIRGAIDKVRGGLTVPAEISSGPTFGGFNGGAVVATQPLFVPVIAMGGLCIAADAGIAGIAASTSGDFGGPMATPKAVRMSKGKDKPLNVHSADELLRVIQDKIGQLKHAGAEWSNVRSLAENLFEKAGVWGKRRRITDIFQPFAAILRSREYGLSPGQVQELLNVYQTALEKGQLFAPIRKMRTDMEIAATRAAKPPKPPRPVASAFDPRRALKTMDGGIGCPERIAALVRSYNSIIDEFRGGNYSHSNVGELQTVVSRLAKNKGEIPPGNNVAETLRALGQTGFYPGGSLRRAFAKNRFAVEVIEKTIEREFGSYKEKGVGRVRSQPRRPTLDQLDGDPSSWGGGEH